MDRGGVIGVVEEIEIKTFSNLYNRDDNDLANEVLNATNRKCLTIN